MHTFSSLEKILFPLELTCFSLCYAEPTFCFDFTWKLLCEVPVPLATILSDVSNWLLHGRWGVWELAQDGWNPTKETVLRLNPILSLISKPPYQLWNPSFSHASYSKQQKHWNEQTPKSEGQFIRGSQALSHAWQMGENFWNCWKAGPRVRTWRGKVKPKNTSTFQAPSVLPKCTETSV